MSHPGRSRTTLDFAAEGVESPLTAGTRRPTRAAYSLDRRLG
jgi:hypothetical protein